jgi:hypothetical protein
MLFAQFVTRGLDTDFLIQQRSLIFSLPMVFLAYGIIGFITAIILYYIRDVPHSGFTQNHVSATRLTTVGTVVRDVPRSGFTQNNFSSTRWTTVGAVGALAGVVTMSLLLYRR